ncbi:hypothetical protein ILUMI_08772, partial [Ignelater luminosus]
YMPKYMYEAKMYPNYLSGTGYVMSTDVAETLFQTALHTPLLHLEDVYLTGICAKTAGIRAINNENFNLDKINFDSCMYQTLISIHYNTPLELRDLYFRIHRLNLKEICKIQKEAQARINTTSRYRRKTTRRKGLNICY